MGSLTQCASLERLSLSRAFGHAVNPYTTLSFGADRPLHFLVLICYKFKLTNTIEALFKDQYVLEQSARYRRFPR